MGGEHKIVFTGRLQPNIDPQVAAAAFAGQFRIAEDKARAVLQANRELVLKQGLDQAAALRYRSILEKIGMQVRLEPPLPLSDASGLTLEPMEAPAGAPAEEESVAVGGKPEGCPKCGSQRIEGGSCLDCGIVIAKYRAIQARQQDSAGSGGSVPGAGAANPYAAPRAELAPSTTEGEMSGPVSVPFSHGWAWLARGFWHLRQNPGIWVLALLLWVGMSIVLSLIPFVGSLLVSLISPVIVAGFMIGADAQQQGDDFELASLFAGFSRNTGQLLLVGLLYLVGMIVIAVIVGAMLMGTFASLGGMGALEAEDPAIVVAVLGSPAFMLALLAGSALAIPLLMAYWFAPPLIALSDLSAFSAMRLSFVGCLKNVLPFLLYGLAGMLLVIVGALPFGLGLLIVMPMIMASIYTGYRDIYYG